MDLIKAYTNPHTFTMVFLLKNNDAYLVIRYADNRKPLRLRYDNYQDAVDKYREIKHIVKYE